MFKPPTKRELAIVIIFLIIFGVYNALNHMILRPDWFNIVSFASTITSIALAIIAIVFTMLESTKNTIAQNNLIDISRDLKKLSESNATDLELIKNSVNLQAENAQQIIEESNIDVGEKFKIKTALTASSTSMNKIIEEVMTSRPLVFEEIIVGDGKTAVTPTASTGPNDE